MSKQVRILTFTLVLLTCITLIGFTVVKAFLPRDHVQVVTNLGRVLPVLNSYKVRVFLKLNGYHTLAYARGQFCSKQASRCTNLQPEQPFDEQATRDFASIDAAFSASGLDIRSVDAQLTGSRNIYYAVFEPNCFLLCGTARYTYSPNAGNLPASIPGVFWHSPLSQDWYLTDEK